MPYPEIGLRGGGLAFEHPPLFPERVNTEFVRIISRTEIEMRVWERGSGETWACGTGACAAVCAAVENSFCDAETDVRRPPDHDGGRRGAGIRRNL